MNSEPLYLADGKSFNVRAFGAKGNGIADDTQAIQAAINAALGYSGVGAPCVLIPAGQYRINMHLGNTDCAVGRLVLGASQGSGRVHIRGEGSATLSTSVDAWPDGQLDFLLAIWSQSFSDVLIENLRFQRTLSTPPALIGPTQQTVAIASMGTRTTIRNCTFIDFPQSLYFFKADAPLVTGCRWIYADGIACGRGPTGGYPNVGLRCDNCSDVQIVDNHWCGTENMGGSTPSWPMDGFVWGSSKGWIIRGNTIRRAFAESINCISTADATSSCIIDGNTLDCDFPAGLDPKLARNAVRVGIRCDESNALIRGNFVRKARSPISINNLDAPGPSGGIIADNLIAFDSFDASVVNPQCSVLYGIALQNRADVAVKDNRISFPAGTVGSMAIGLPSVGVMVTNCTRIDVSENSVECAASPAAGQDVPGIRLAGNNDGTTIGGNTFKNMSKELLQDPGSSGSVQTQPNTLFQTPQAA